MPTYDFKNLETGEEWEAVMTYEEKLKLLKDPNIESVIKPSRIHYSAINQKPSDGFRDVLKQIKKGSGSGNTIETF